MNKLRAMCLAQVAVVALACAHPKPQQSTERAAQPAPRSVNMEELLSQAEETTGLQYLTLESEARQRASGNDVQVAALKRIAGQPSPVKALLALVLLDWLGARSEPYQQALDYLERIAQKMAPTPRGTPSPEAVAAQLTQDFSGSLTKLLALRLAQDDTWPYWKAAAATLYLKQHFDASTTAAVLRFAIRTPDKRLRALAVDALQAHDDPQLDEVLRHELKRAARLQLPVAAEVKGLR
jgi:hypothetical protein